MPCANGSRRSNDKIYKRITASPKVDHEYQAALVELQSQGFGERKRARAEVHVRPYGDALFEEIKKDEISGQERLDIARGRLRILFFGHIFVSFTFSFPTLSRSFSKATCLLTLL